MEHAVEYVESTKGSIRELRKINDRIKHKGVTLPYELLCSGRNKLRVEKTQMELVSQGIFKLDVNQQHMETNIKRQIKRLLNCGINLCNSYDGKN